MKDKVPLSALCRGRRDGLVSRIVLGLEVTVLAIAVFGTTVSGRELLIVALVVVVIVASIWFLVSRRR